METVFITGASSGIGKATAKLFQSKGWNVIATMRNPEKERELTQLKNVTVLPLDITNPEQIRSTVKKALSMGDINIVLNNAGIALMGALEALNDEQILNQVNTNFLGTVRVTQAFIPYFREKKSGLFINVTSTAGFTGFPYVSIYNGTKWALEGWSECLAIELAPFNIGVKTVLPEGTKTPFHNYSASNIASHPVYDEAIKKVLSIINLNTTPEQIAEVIYDAATDKKDQLRYPAGETAKALYARRTEIGPEEFRKETTKFFLSLF